MDTERTAAHLDAVADEVVGLGAHLLRMLVQEREIVGVGHGEGMVHGVVALRLFVPFEQGEVHYPERSENVRVAQSQARGQFHAQGAERFAGAVGSAGHK